MAARITSIVRTPGLRDTGMRLVDGGDVAGILEIVGRNARGTLRVGQDALRDGILLGRYARCDGAIVHEDPSLSRVHAIFVQLDDRLLVIDTASRNGTRASGARSARVIAVKGSTELRARPRHWRVRLVLGRVAT